MSPTSIVGVVFVHGAYHGGWCWEPVRPLLDKPSVAVDLPGRGSRPADGQHVSLAMCVDAVLDDADAAGFDRFLLVGHSLGGLTVAETANRAPDRVGGVVYLTALAPKPGQCFFDVSSRYDGIPDGIDPTGVQAVMSEPTAHRFFCGDLDPATFTTVYARLVAEPMGLFLATLSGYSSQVPATYVRCTRDVILPLWLADDMIANLGRADVRDLDSDHDAMLSHPEELAALLNDIVAGR